MAKAEFIFPFKPYEGHDEDMMVSYCSAHKHQEEYIITERQATIDLFMNRLSDLAIRYLGGESSSQSRHPSVTPADFSELQRTARLLRIELDEVIEDQVANDEACGMANDNIVRLRALTAERRRERDALRREADEASGVWKEVWNACCCEERKRSAIREEVAHLREEARRSAMGVFERRKEIQQIKSKVEMNDADMVFQLRAELQNMKMDCEMEGIRLRKLKSQRDSVYSDVEEKKRRQDEIQCYVASLRKEIDEARTELEINKTRYQLLVKQLQAIGGKVPNENILSSVKDMLTKMSAQKDPDGRNNDLAQSKATQTFCDDDKLQLQEHRRCANVTVDESNQHNLQEQTQPSLFTSDQLHKSPRIFLMGVNNKTNGESCSNVYSKPGHHGVSILCKDDDSVVSALTVDETEFHSLFDGVEEEQK
ncbi:hypothetical protein HJC23_003442 [Cyclotella cryptica]|uniref:Uncharacterized protein n=1 Tax=Cyclotella cryptica TaxID=29204 RepID=A0ABD3QSQ0_9STRA|eukprot:CCRYP_002573-RA/>CCRYP_002573-RA protein AED:0.03 eAED:0.03 QI:74/1/1/1/0/0/2/400/424